MTPAELREAITECVRRALPEVHWLASFGSVARGDATAESDVDVALLAPMPVESRILRDLRGDLEEAVKRDVHLVDLRGASTVVRSEIVGTVDVLFASGDAEAEAFLGFVLSDYARLNEERARILRDVQARGRVHGR